MSLAHKLFKIFTYLLAFTSVIASAILFFLYNDKDCQFAIEGSTEYSRCYASIYLSCDYPAISMSGRLPTMDSNIDVHLNCAWDIVTIYFGYLCNAIAGGSLLVSMVNFSQKPLLWLTVIKIFGGFITELGLLATLGFMVQNVIQGRKSVFLYYEKPMINMKTDQDFYLLNIGCVVLSIVLVYVINYGIYKNYKAYAKQRRSTRKSLESTYELEGGLSHNSQEKLDPLL